MHFVFSAPGCTDQASALELQSLLLLYHPEGIYIHISIVGFECIKCTSYKTQTHAALSKRISQIIVGWWQRSSIYVGLN